MVFTLVSSSQEWLALKIEELKLKKEEEKERRLKDAEEAERVRNLLVLNTKIQFELHVVGFSFMKCFLTLEKV